jgi:hypothetical protein
MHWAYANVQSARPSLAQQWHANPRVGRLWSRTRTGALDAPSTARARPTIAAGYAGAGFLLINSKIRKFENSKIRKFEIFAKS